MNTDALLTRCAVLALAASALMCGGKGASQNSPSDSTAGAPATNATGGALNSSIASGAQSTTPVTGGAPNVGTSSTVNTLANGGAALQSGGVSGLGSLGGRGGTSTSTHAAVAGRASTMTSTGAASSSTAVGGTGTQTSTAVAGSTAIGGSCGENGTGALCGLAEPVEIRPSNVLIVLDRSRSMLSIPAGAATTKWESMRHALSTLLASRATSVEYGLLVYPDANSNDEAVCEVRSGTGAIHVPVGPTSLIAPRIEQLLADTAPAGGTPTTAALEQALEYYTSGEGAALQGPKYVLLVTDGGPNCNGSIVCSGETCTANLDRSGSCGTGVANCCDMENMIAGGISPALLCLDDQAVNTRLQELLTRDIRTFVVGIPGTEVYATYLDEFAIAGGVPRVPSSARPHRYYAVSTEAELTNALTTIAASLGRECNIPLEGGPFDSALLSLAINCELLPARTAQGQNWTYDPSTNSITIAPSTCGELQTKGISRIDVIRGCPAN